MLVSDDLTENTSHPYALTQLKGRKIVLTLTSELLS